MSSSLNEELVRDWDRIKRIALNPKITSAKKYLSAVAKGAKQAERLLLKKGEVIPTLDTIREVHFVMFKDIHPWAGDFRKEGEEVRAGDLICTLSTEIEGELKTLNAEMNGNPLKGGKKYLTEVIAFYHASLLAIHPFLDGNGRLSRLILDHQVKMLLKASIDFTNFERAFYINTDVYPVFWTPVTQDGKETGIWERDTHRR